MDIFVTVLCADLKHTKRLDEGYKFYTLDLKTLEVVESYVCAETMDSDVVKFETEDSGKAYIRKMLS